MLVLFAGVVTMCSKSGDYPDAPENGRDHNVFLKDTNGGNQANQ